MCDGTLNAHGHTKVRWFAPKPDGLRRQISVVLNWIVAQIY